MNDHRGKFKWNAGGSNDPSISRMFRAEQHEERRKVNRAAYYSRYRDLSKSPEKQPQMQQDREIRFQKWQREKALKKKLEQRNKKPVFKVGIVHHHFYSPVGNDKKKEKPVPCHTRGARKIKVQPSPPKRITRATQKRLEAKKNALALASVPIPETSSASIPSPGKHIPFPGKHIPSPKDTTTLSFAPGNYTFKGPTGVERLPLFGKFVPRDSAVSKDDLSEDGSAELSKPGPDIPPSSQKASPKQELQSSLIRQNAFDSTDLPVNPVSTSTQVFIEQKNDKNVDSDPGSEAVECNCDKNVESDSIETPPRSGSPIPALFSPYITTSRGKDSARRERRSKLGIERTTPEDIPTKETVMQILNISVEEEERTAQHFKYLLEGEVTRLKELCSKWEKVKEEPDVPEDGLYLINQAVGQTNLLMRKKFERFRSLVLDCETGKGQMLVRCRDLQGFWETMYMEVENCDSRFQKLETLRSRDWIEDEVVMPVKKPTGTKKKVIATKTVRNGKSSIRSWILAKKKKMAQAEEPSEDGTLVENNSATSMPSTSETIDDATADNVSLQHQKNTRRSIKKTPNRTPVSLLKKVQLSQSRKSIHSPLAVMKISKLCKTPEVRLDDTISYVNSDQTPQKSILKKSTTDDSVSASDTTITKSTRKVDFNDEVIANEAGEIDENLENSIDLGRALARIDSYDSDESAEEIPESPAKPSKNVTVRRIEKRLDFEDESFNEIEKTEIATAINREIPIIDTPDSPPLAQSSLPIISITEATPLGPSSKRKYSKSKRRTSTVADSPSEEKQPEQEQSETRVLRNRIVSMNTPNRSNRRSTKMLDSSKLDHDLDSSTKENDNPATVEREIVTDDQLTNRRRSTRRSVRFNADVCSGCTESFKPVHPVTPHSRRSRKISLLGDDSRQSIVPLTNGDLMSFDSPSRVAIPPRVRRTNEYTKKHSGQ